METSRAVVVKKFGNYDVLSVEQFKLPELKEAIEVKVEYGGVNFADIYTRQGLMPHKLPFVLGMECVGTITKIDTENSSNLHVGQRVICYDYHCGMFRDVVRVSSDKIYPLPDSISFEDGAAIFVNYLTAYFSIIELGNLKENDTVLILSCGGGVGWAATQLAKNIPGVTVVGTASAEKHPEVEKNGVDLTLIHDENFETNIKQLCPKGFDLILTNYAGSLYGVLEKLVKPLGRIVIIGANNLIKNENKLSGVTKFLGWFATKNVSVGDLIQFNRVTAGLHLGTLIDQEPEKVRHALEVIFQMFKEEKLKVRLHGVFNIEKIVDATKVLAERKNIGKVLVSFK